MKKILTLMAAMAAASSAMAHDYKWSLPANPAVDDNGYVKDCYGNNLKFVQTANKFTFDANTGDKISLDVTGDNTKLTVTAGNAPLDVTIENGKPTFSVNADLEVTITFEEGTVITGITVESDSYRVAKGLVDEANDILDARVNNISKYVNIEGNGDENNKFYLAVRALVNEQGGYLTEVSELLEKFAESDLMDLQIGDNAIGSELDGAFGVGDKTLVGKAYIESLLDVIKTAIGTKVEVRDVKKEDSNEVKEEKEKEKGSILVEAENAFAKYDSIVKVKDDSVKAAKAEIDAQKDSKKANGFHEANKNGTIVEKWTKDNTASKTRALDLFATYVEGYYTTQKNKALDALNKFEDLTELNKLPKTFDKVTEYSNNLQKRYDYEEATRYTLADGTTVTNYKAISELANDVVTMETLAGKGYKKDDGTALFDVTGLDGLKDKGTALFTKISSTENKHTLSDMDKEFSTPYNTIKSGIDAKKIAWGEAAKKEITTKLTDVQTRLSNLENTITTKYQNDAATLKEYQTQFAQQQVIVNNVKEAVEKVSTAAEAFKVANGYNENMDKLNAVDAKLTELWQGTQNAENNVIIEKNNAALKALEAKKNALDNYSNEAVAKLNTYRNDDFFKGQDKLLQTIAASIKTIYDYSNEVRDAYTAAKTEVDKCNHTDVVNKEIKSVIADLSTCESTITTKKGEIETALNNALTDVNDFVKGYFENTTYPYGPFMYGKAYIKGKKDTAADNAKKNVAINAEKDAALVDANKLFDKAINGEKKNGALVASQKDIANAEAKLDELYADKTLADDVVKGGPNTIQTIITNAQNEADIILAKFNTYAGYKKDLYDIEVEWSVNRATSVKEGDAALIKELDELHKKISETETKLTETDKLTAGEEYTQIVNAFKSKISLTKNSETYKAYNNITTAKENAEKQIADAEAAYKELTKDTAAKTALKAAIDAANATLTSANTAFESSLADGTFSNQAESLLKQYQGIDLTKAVDAAKEADKVVPGDYVGGGENGMEPDGKVDINDLTYLRKMVLNEDTYGDKDFVNFMKIYRATINEK